MFGWQMISRKDLIPKKMGSRILRDYTPEIAK